MAPSRGSERSSSILKTVQVTVPEGGISFSAHLLDPYIALRRPFGPDTIVRCHRPPTAPYDAGERKYARPKKRRKPNAHEQASDGSTLQAMGITSFQGKASRTAASADAQTTIRYDKGWSDEQEHHKGLKPLALAALEALNGPASARSSSQDSRDDFATLQLLGGQDVVSSFDWTALASTASESHELYNLSEEPSTRRLARVSTAPETILPPRSGFALATMQGFATAIDRGRKSLGIRSFDLVVIEYVTLFHHPWIAFLTRYAVLLGTTPLQRDPRHTLGWSSMISLASTFARVWAPTRAIRRLWRSGSPTDQKCALSPLHSCSLWSTDRDAQFRRFLKSKFLPDSNVVGPYAEWYWIKTVDDSTSSVGQPIFDLDSDSPRRCYEGLVIGRYEPPGFAGEQGKELPYMQTFASVPLGHSRKPDILGWSMLPGPASELFLILLDACADLLTPYLPSRPNVLELFARAVGCVSTSQGGVWLSVGNEACKFNAEPWVSTSEVA